MGRGCQKPCFAASSVLESAQMHLSFKQNVRWFKPVIAGLMVGVVLLLAVFSSSEGLHLKLHQDSTAPQHGPCAICSVVQGHLELPVADASGVFASSSVSWTLPASLDIASPDADFSVASSRGPPVSVSSL